MGLRVWGTGLTVCSPDWILNSMTDQVATCSRDGCERALTLVHDATGIDAEGRVGPVWTCKVHRTELWMREGDSLVVPLEWWPDFLRRPVGG